MTRRLVMGPFNRVEGDLEVHLEIEAGRVSGARITAPLYRGFEQILQDRPPLDALVIAPRICGICSVSQSSAAVQALANLSGANLGGASLGGTSPPDNGRLTANLLLACENIADHLTHFYLFFMPDFARTAYAGQAWYAATAERFVAMTGQASAQLLPARARFLNVMGTLAGKWPHTLALQPGGSTRAIDAGDKMRLLSVLAETREFLETVLFAAPLEEVAALDTPQALDRWCAAKPWDRGGDLRHFLHIARLLGLEEIGRGRPLFLSHGSFADDAGGLAFRRGVWERGAGRPFSPESVTEDTHHSWMSGPTPLPPFQGQTQPEPEKAGAYSWCKAPRLAGQGVEVGALARQVVDGQPLLRSLAGEDGGAVHSRVLARLIEVARVVPMMEGWARALRPRAPFCHQTRLPEEGQGLGLVEAARGALGHWLRVREGRIHSYQIIAPTTWNFSPRDAQGQPGPVEQALSGTLVSDNERVPVAVQHVIRSFDPCMACTVH